MNQQERDSPFKGMMIPVGIILVLLLSSMYIALTERVSVPDRLGTRIMLDFRKIGEAIDGYYTDTQKMPSSLLDLVDPPVGVKGWEGPYLPKGRIPLDPWNRSYLLKIPGKNGEKYEIITLGADGVAGGDGENEDISSHLR